MRRAGLLIAVAVLACLVGVGAWLLARSPVAATSAGDRDVEIVCAASTGVDEAGCAEWGDEILAAGPPSTTFEMDDLARLELSRALLGFGGECEVAYILGRYPDSPVWTEQVACSGAG